MADIPLVVDLYHGDRVTSFSSAHAAGVRGIIHKATTGETGRDKSYKDRRTAARNAGLLWGAYHWGTHVSVDRQVDNFLKYADPAADTLVSLDFEKTKGNQMTLEQAREFLQLVGQKLGRKPVIYSGDTLKSALGRRKDTFLGDHRLWLAQYGTSAEVQASWKAYWLWQFTDGKDRPGVPAPKVPGLPGDSKGRLDSDRYDGTEEQLAAEWAS